MKKNRIQLILFCLIFAPFCFSQKPNIVYILADDLGIGDVSSYNPNGKIITPNIDQLAKSGVRFTDAHTTSSVCTPTRYGIMTGRYSWRTTLKNGVLQGYSTALFDDKRETVASFLQKQGYATGIVGKWHLGWNWNNIKAGDGNVDFSKQVLEGPNARGFDYSFCIAASLDMPPYAYVENGFCTAIPKDSIAEMTGIRLFRAGLVAPDFKPEEVLGKFAEIGIAYINQNAKKEKPFFLYLPLAAPHTPILPIGKFAGKSGVSPYGDFVLMVDDVVKQVVDALKKNGIYENTLIVFASDNGFANPADMKAQLSKGHSPSMEYRGVKTDIFEGGHRVPFIVSWGGKFNSGKVSSQLVSTTDFFRTISELTKGQLTDNVAEDSFSFLSEINGNSSNFPKREAVVHHSATGFFAIRKGIWKLIMCPHSGGNSLPKENSEEVKTLPLVQLYNMESDFSETKNVQDKHPEIVKELTDLLTKYIQNGRSTQGATQTNEGPKHWKQLSWMKEQD